MMPLAIDAGSLARLETTGARDVYRHKAPPWITFTMIMRPWAFLGIFPLVFLLIALTLQHPTKTQPWGLLIGTPLVFLLLPGLWRSRSSVELTVDRDAKSLTLRSW